MKEGEASRMAKLILTSSQCSFWSPQPRASGHRRTAVTPSGWRPREASPTRRSCPASRSAARARWRRRAGRPRGILRRAQRKRQRPTAASRCPALRPAPSSRAGAAGSAAGMRRGAPSASPSSPTPWGPCCKASREGTRAGLTSTTRFQQHRKQTAGRRLLRPEDLSSFCKNRILFPRSNCILIALAFTDIAKSYLSRAKVTALCRPPLDGALEGARELLFSFACRRIDARDEPAHPYPGHADDEGVGECQIESDEGSENSGMEQR